MDLAREHGLSAQAVRNYERQGLIPAAGRTATGHRTYTERHRIALRAFLAQLPAHGYATAGEIMRAVDDDDLDVALRAVDRSHAQLLRDRETLDAVEAAVGVLTAAAPVEPRALPISAVARRLGVTPATLRKWERAGILTPRRERVTGYRLYDADDIRDAELAHLLRRGGYLLGHIAPVVAQVRTAGGVEPLVESLAGWRERLTARARAMLTAAARLDDYLRFIRAT
ncbi:TioE family transcriptional regulator [Cryptosporangium phraense]|uniref:TioE family transcriptional regulator n=1 Tax=Cryptosporangium phraense TaxID=2593070 RepID=UPI001F10B669|nr:TioE family transcriptional regulator [Cryptosporangium phraense]